MKVNIEITLTKDFYEIEVPNLDKSNPEWDLYLEEYAEGLALNKLNINPNEIDEIEISGLSIYNEDGEYITGY